MNARFDHRHEETDARFTVVEAAIRGIAGDVRDLRTNLRRVEDKVDGLSPLEARVTALERDR